MACELEAMAVLSSVALKPPCKKCKTRWLSSVVSTIMTMRFKAVLTPEESPKANVGVFEVSILPSALRPNFVHEIRRRTYGRL